MKIIGGAWFEERCFNFQFAFWEFNDYLMLSLCQTNFSLLNFFPNFSLRKDELRWVLWSMLATETKEFTSPFGISWFTSRRIYLPSHELLMNSSVGGKLNQVRKTITLIAKAQWEVIKAGKKMRKVAELTFTSRFECGWFSFCHVR